VTRPAANSAKTTNGAKTLVVLIVEDELLVRDNVAACLRDDGFAVIETVSGEEAIAFCRSDRSIDIVFTDINLDGAATGWDVADAFQRDRPNVPVLYTSGKSIDPKRRIPGSVFLAKPYKGSDVVQVCQEVAARL
jgi:CheY-like chemotaxis protein